MKTTVALLALGAAVTLGYSMGLSRNEAKVLHAAEAGKWVKVEIPLTVFVSDNENYAAAKGFWQSTSPNKDRQLAFPVAVSITCWRSERTCKESEASVIILGALSAELTEYDISSWTRNGIVAEGPEGACGTGHRLSLDFKNNSVTVTDYPKRILGSDCRPFQEANSYALHGGYLMLRPPATWEPLAKVDESK